MKRQYRVTKNEDFEKIINKGRHVATKKFVLYYMPTSFDYARVGISVGKKIGNAVERNKVKRQLRMIIQESFDFNIGMDYIVIVRKAFTLDGYQDNKKDLSELYNSVYNVQRTN